MKITGSSSRIDAMSRPLASYALDGITTFRPGMWHTSASRLWLCWAARFIPAPAAVMTVTGRRALPPNMYFIFASWFMS